MGQDWTGEARLEVFRGGFAETVQVDLFRKPSQPGRVPGWGGAFRAGPLSIPATGRGAIVFPDGTAADVMVESFDAVTGAGTFFGLGPPPPML
jgi:hypothetical protein